MIRYFERHWRGQLPLAQSFWVNGILVLLPFVIWFELAGDYLLRHPPIKALTFLAVLGPAFVLFLGVDIWVGTGIWRSAGRRMVFGRPGWAWVARLAVVLNFILVSFAAILLAHKVQVMLWPSNDAPYEITLHGTTAVFRGQLTPAAAEELDLLLTDKSVRRLAIAGSDGGEIKPALQLARLIRARRLSVVALSQCDEACTLLLAAGGARAAAPQTVIRFADAGAEALAVYRAAGLAGPLLERLSNIQSDTSYEPTLRTLIINRFLTDILADDLHRYVPAPVWCAKNIVVCTRTGGQNKQIESRSGRNGDGA